MDPKNLQYYLNLSKKSKDTVKSIYNEVLKYTDTTYQIQDAKGQLETPSEIDSLIPICLNDLTSFLMTSMFSRSQKWASITMDNQLYRLVNGTLQDYQIDSRLTALNTKLEAAGNVVFTYLNQSNYYNEIARSLREAVNLGTGAYRILEVDNPTQPFIFQYVPQNDLFFYEDAFGRPVYVFKFYRDVNQESLKLMFGEDVKIPSVLEKDPIQATTTIVECITPSETNKNGFTLQIMNEGLTEEYKNVELDYMPINIFRWHKEGNNPNGIGLSVVGLKAFKELSDLKEKRKTSAEKLLNPPVFLRGDKTLAMALSLEANAVNYAGNQPQTAMSGLNPNVDVYPIQTVGSLLPLDNDIREKEMYIRELYTSNPLGNVDQFKRRSALEVEVRLNQIRKKWAISFELMEKELLMPTFLTPLKILVRKRNIEFDEGDLDMTMITYKNALALSQDVQSIDMVSMYIERGSIVANSGEALGLDSNKTLVYFMNSLGLPSEIRQTEDEMAARRAEQQKLMAAQFDKINQAATQEMPIQE